MGLLPPIVAVLEGDISGFTSKMDQAKGKLDEVDKLSTGISKRQVQAVATGMLAIGGVFTGVGGVLVAQSDKIEKAEASLRTTIENTGGSWSAYKGRIDEAVKSQEHFGHGSADTQEALAKLTAAYQDPTKALKEMSLATEIAAFKHISLTDAAGMVVRMHGGAARTFKEFGINISDMTKELKAAEVAHKANETAVANLNKAQAALSDLEARDAQKKKLSLADEQTLAKAKEAVAMASDRVKTTSAAEADAQAKAQGATVDHEKQMALLEKRIHGVAQAQADTFGGRLDAIRAGVENFTGSIGKGLGPALIGLGPLLMGLGGVMQIFTVITWAGVAATWAFLWPILAVVAGIAILVGGFIFAYTHFKPFHDAVNALAGILVNALGAAIGWLGKTWGEVWPAISTALGVAWGIIKPILNFLVDVAIVEVRLGILLLQAIWNGAWAAIHGAIAFYSPPIRAILGLIGAAFKPIGDALTWLKNNVWDPLWNGILATVQAVWKVLGPIFAAIGNALSPVVAAIGKVAGAGDLLKNLPHFQSGGPVPGSGPQLAVLHGGEFVLSQAMMAHGVGSGGGGNTYVTVQVQGPVLNWNDTAEALAEPVRAALLRRGRNIPSLGLG